MATWMQKYETLIAEVDRKRLPAISAFRGIIGDMDLRVARAEAVSVDADAAIQELRERGLTIIAETLAPLVEEAEAATAEARGYLLALQSEGLSGALVALAPIEDLPGATNAQVAIGALAGSLAELSGVLAAITALETAVGSKAPAVHGHPITAIDNLDPRLEAVEKRRSYKSTAVDTTASARASTTYNWICDALTHGKQSLVASRVKVWVTVIGTVESTAGGTDTRGGLSFWVLVGATWTQLTAPFGVGDWRTGNSSAFERGCYFWVSIPLDLDDTQMVTGNTGWSIAVQGAVIIAGQTITVTHARATFEEVSI